MTPLARVILCIGLFLSFSVTLFAQEEELPESSSDMPEEVVEFYQLFFTQYMDNYERISDLETLRSAGADDRASDLAEEIQKKTDEPLSKLQNLYRDAREKEVRSSILRGMRMTLKLYPLYIEKVIENWKPTEEQVLKRRRMSDNQLIQRDPNLASAALIRRVFLGELFSTMEIVPGMDKWFEKRTNRVNSWIRSQYNEIFPLYERLLSRVLRVLNNDDTSEERRQKVVRQARQEWKKFWENTGNGSKWSEMRNQVQRLRSLFRNRSNRLPGTQRMLKEQVVELQKKMGELVQIQVDKPFLKRENRLKLLLRLSKAFVRIARDSGTGSAGQSISRMTSAYLSGFVNRVPKEYWSAKNKEQLNKKRREEIQTISSLFKSLNLMFYKDQRKRYDFPFDAVFAIVRRLGLNYGKEEKKIARNVRDIAKFVQSRYYLATKSLDMIRAYLEALKKQEFSSPAKYVKFEKTFRNEYQTEWQNSRRHINRLDQMETKIDDMIDRVKNIKPEELASAYLKDQKQKKQQRQSR